MPEVHVKAVPVNGLVQFVQRELSAEQLQSVLSSMGDDAKYFTGHLLASDAVPLTQVNQFTVRAAEAKREPVKHFARRAGRFGAELGLKSVYKFILMVLSVEYVLRKAPVMWTRVYDGGVMSVEAEPNKATIRVTNFPAHEAGCARITGWFEYIGERAGAKEIRLLHTECMAEGAKECIWRFAWK